MSALIIIAALPIFMVVAALMDSGKMVPALRWCAGMAGRLVVFVIVMRLAGPLAAVLVAAAVFIYDSRHQIVRFLADASRA